MLDVCEGAPLNSTDAGPNWLGDAIGTALLDSILGCELGLLSIVSSMIGGKFGRGGLGLLVCFAFSSDISDTFELSVGLIGF